MSKILSLLALCFCCFIASFAYAQDITPCSGDACTQGVVLEKWNENTNGFITQNWKTPATVENFSSKAGEYTNTYESVLKRMKRLGESGKLFILPSGAARSVYASAAAGMPILDKTLYPYLINVVAYNSASNISQSNFIDVDTNLAKGVENWSLSALGTGKIEDDCTSNAAQAVANAAQAVKNKFPYLDSLKIAGVLLSTASSANDLLEDLPEGTRQTDFMYRTNASGTQFLFFTDINSSWDEEKKNAKVAEILGTGECGSGIECIDVTSSEAFGVGFLDEDKALGGPAAFEAERLSQKEKTDGYFYTVKVDSASTWANDIKQIGTTAVGLKKQGTADLTLKGANAFSGKTIIEAGRILLAGESEDKKASLGNITVQKGAGFLSKYGNASTVQNEGTVTLQNGSSLSEITNNGTFIASGKVSVGTTTNNSTSTTNNISATFIGSITNNGYLTAGNSVEGDITNNKSAFLKMNGLTLKGKFTNTGETKATGSVKLIGESINAGFFATEGTGTVTVVNAFNNMGLFDLKSSGSLLIQADTDPDSTSVGTFVNANTLTLAQNSNIRLLKNTKTGEKVEQPVFINMSNITLSENSNIYLEAGTDGLISIGKIIGSSNTTSQITGGGVFYNQGTINSSMYISQLENENGNIIMDSVINAPPIPLRGDYFKLISGRLTFDTSKILPFNSPTGGTYTLIETTNALKINELKFQIETFGSPYLNIIRNTTDDKKYQVDVTFNKIDTTSPTFDSEEIKVGQVIDRYFFNDVENTIAGFYYLTESDLRKKINEMRERVQPFSAQELPLANTMADNVYARLFSLHNEKYISPNLIKGRAGGDLTTHNKVWGQFIAGMTRIKANKETSAKKTDAQILGAMFGYDFALTDNFLIGITGGWAESQVEQGDNKTDVTDWRAGVYFDAAAGNFSLQGLALAGKQNFTTDKHIVIPGLTAHTQADFDGSSIEGGLSLGYRLFSRNQEGLSRRYFGAKGRQVVGNPYFSLKPYVSGYYSKSKQDAYKETGNPLFTMAVSESSDTSASIQPGVAMFFATQYSNITIDIGYRRMLTGGNPETTAYFTGDSLQVPFKTLAAQEDKDYAVLGLGYSTRLLKNLSFNLNLNSSASKESLSSILSAAFIYTW